jgi:PIN domain nuclease of toxin-antitoxin system
MPEFNVHEAKSNLSRLLALVEQGEEVTIMRGGQPVADMVRHRRLPMIHKDPFDRLLLAQAASESWVLVGNDETVRQYEVATVW